MTRPLPPAALPSSSRNTTPGPREPRPLRRSPAPCRRSGWRAHAPQCVPAPGALPRGPRSSRLCHLTVVVAGGGRGAARGAASRGAGAASSPPFRPGPGSVPALLPLSTRVRTGRSEPPPPPGATGASWPRPPRVWMEPSNLYPVKLYVYDLSKGLARRLSPIMLGEEGGGGGRGAGAQAQGRRRAQRMEKCRGGGRGGGPGAPRSG